MKVEPEEVKNAMIKNDISSIDIRPCSMCGHVLTYKMVVQNLFIDTNCNCVTYTTDLEPREFSELSDWLNRILDNDPSTDHAIETFSSMGLDINNYNTVRSEDNEKA